MNLNGILVPIVTPFDANNQLNEAALERLVECFIEAGVGGIVACGTTGEYYALSAQERRRVLEIVAKTGRGRTTLIAGVNSMSPAEAISRIREAEELGYEALMLSPTPYSLPGQNEVVAYFKEVAAATELPIVMYNFPARIGIQIELESVYELAKVKNIVGIKESSGNFSRVVAMVNANLPDFQVVCGCDDQAADFLFWGVRSWISGGANVFPAEQVQMLKAAEQGDWDSVRRMMAAMLPAIAAMESGNYNQKAKLGCVRHGIDVGSVRLPLLPVEAQERDDFLAQINAYQVEQEA
ncbi:4-hydroxy-tetrahydrodipicolinate synthase [Alcaligenes faecalis]|jgi:4-hydroxy-tetrahydrodipicolinate synthase|uniref:4-hydroxy-tetrahydrodipicolinate synthase n=1 Tax=Alcaligenes faecalis TaxID=511 RepID=A0ABY7N738_ALCFA|nr:4-hydroxy-tetrahydrodipicolinate synthase [Alcaligenes faecalis]KAA1285509.1 4-hydroxy-tetrahydrodipicolinate synthase [Alcaligenes faecalis]MBQ0216867.1 4-hydroxy-tetrahydrodipicolinate synthase [Alcaligenes faecalis]OSZ34745.1 4-hydroxy-tetrahydrodipicolinate synthase [Alcaligenes faecalis]OSZ43224.1 4-hydroxy-tetrahydrodipicolinate synthase [Alcaligenes faecalis]USP48757.1 4-hydroxy-tetrahydrodipicolinate synthase [Alcaligenes faecalis]